MHALRTLVPTRAVVVGSLLALMLSLLATPPSAEAYDKRSKNLNSSCSITAHAFEHFTKARHVSERIGCSQISQSALRRCHGTNYRTNTAPTTVNPIDKSWKACDAIGTTTYGYQSGSYLGSVYSGA